MQKDNNTLDPWYVTGLAEGESTFTYNTSYGHITLVFAIKFTNSEGALLEKVKDFFDAGKIYKVKAILPGPSTGYTKSALYYKVFSLTDLVKILDHFEKYPLKGEKRRRYDIWKQMFFIKKKLYKRRKVFGDDYDKLCVLARELSKLAPKNIPWDGLPDQLINKGVRHTSN